MKVKEIDQMCRREGIPLPAGLSKPEKLEYIEAYRAEAAMQRDPEVVSAGSANFLYRLRSECAPVEMDFNEDLSTHFLREGWAVVKIPDWSDDFVDMFFDWLESCCANFSRNDESTWICKNLPPNVHGIFKHRFGHTRLQWLVRLLCVPIFAEIWCVEPEDLLCSFDGGCFLSSRMKGKAGKNEHWVHCDSPRGTTDLDSIQGIVNFLDNGPEDGGLVLVEHSFHDLPDYFETHPTYGYGWGKADVSYAGFAQRRIIKVCAPAGHLILFDSRTFHCNKPPSARGSLRMCLYVCMQPRQNASAAELKKRIELYENGRMTGHACYGKWFSTNPKEPRTYGKSKDEMNLPETVEIATIEEQLELQRRLIGY